MRRLIISGIFVFFAVIVTAQSSLSGKKICIDPGHGGTASTDQYRVGVNGEREEWINLRVALLLKELLLQKGASVVMTRVSDTMVALADRAALAVKEKADVFISIHHNATADRSVNFPIIYFHGAVSENQASVQLGKHLARSLRKYFFRSKTPVSLVSDYTVFPAAGAAVLRGTYGIPGLLAEASFFTNAKEEEKLKQEKHNKNEAIAFMHALELFFTESALEIKPKKIPFDITPFPVYQEAERMKPEALLWKENFYTAKKLLKKKDAVAKKKSYEMFTSSVRSFPDSWLARKCHKYRTQLLLDMQNIKEAQMETIRVTEFYTNFKL